MCGILGQISFNGSKTAVPQLQFISHRGPDGSGEWYNDKGNVYLGHTRLAILEPTPAGYQPMISASDRFTITFNGEIYNHLELRKLMPHQKWNGGSDTETLIELLALKGVEALKLVKGMFAFALYDSIEGSLLLVRDRLGIKPLWVKSGNKSVSFSSEVRALVAGMKTDLTKEALSEYIGFGHMPGAGEIYEGVASMEPGSWMKVFANGKIEKGNWWGREKFITERPANRKDCVQSVKKLVTKAVEEHLISDVGVGAFLSGGIDSSIVTIIAGKALGRNLQTFTIGFPQGGYDERVIARKVAKQVGSEHFELEVTEEMCLDSVKQAVESLDLPSVDAINTFIVSKAVRDIGLKVALSGLGGDELFGGYPSFKSVPLLRVLSAFPAGIRSQLVGMLPGNLQQKLAGLRSFTTEDLTATRRRFVSVPHLKTMGLESGMPVIAPTPPGLDTMGKISWAEMQGYMIPMLLRDSDQMSMAVGLEIRVPFLDHRLVEEVISFPQQYKTGKGVKPLLIDAFKEELPTEVYDRPKQGFVLPLQDWIKGPLLNFTNEGVEAAAGLLELNEPLLQRDLFLEDKLHWTRVWKWCVVGHWLAKQKNRREHEASYGLKTAGIDTI
jgi:asparagine synthase (glutamine-hydrolysing)